MTTTCPTARQASSEVCVLIAEVGSVHDGRFGNAGELIEAVAAASADVVEFQTHLAAANKSSGTPPCRRTSRVSSDTGTSNGFDSRPREF